MKRGRAEPLVDDVALCLQMGWTWEELQRQPTRFLERLRIYLGTLEDVQRREEQRLEDELRRMGGRRL